MQRVEPPAGSPLGQISVGVGVSKSETERDIITLRYTMPISKVDLKIANRNGYAMIEQGLNMLRTQMQNRILNLFFHGNDGASLPDLPDISGAFDVGEDIGATLDTTYWATATSPVTHAKAVYDGLIANIYYPPFSWVLSWPLASGLQALNNAANPRTHEEIIRAGYISGGIYYVAEGTSAYGAGGYNLYPMTKSGDDGCYIGFAPTNGAGEMNFWMAEVTNGIETRVHDSLDENNNYVYEMEWRGTPVFRGATTGSASSAPYIVYMPDVDLAS